ncbi:MAG: S26 family signal peptidase [Candidatus Thermoplasmatota archaeon]|nr:S26 family signal peptidase [Candidatus Thermoplasmatota archaeon]MBU1941399.1 S26 family signal peptidase [Candidatus Thermoplasmatota archaeon]
MDIPKKILQFWRSDNEKISLLRDIIVALLAVLLVLMILWTYTGQWFAAPMVAIESGSMEHNEEPFGRYGTINAGDMVLVVNVNTYADLIVHGGDFGGAQAIGDPNNFYYGDWGDVVIYKPLGRDDVSQIIHRLMCWVEVNSQGGQTTYTIQEYGIINDTSISIPELGLRNSKPSWTHSGYLTKGDNNNVIDQISDICPQPVKLGWISGKARLEIPWLGTINLLFEDLLNGKNTVQNVHQDCLISLAIFIAILVSIPIILDLRDYFRDRKEKEI